MRFCGIYLRVISQQVPNLPLCVLSLEIILLKLLNLSDVAVSLLFSDKRCYLTEPTLRQIVTRAWWSVLTLLVAPMPPPMWVSTYTDIVAKYSWCHQNAVSFLPNSYNRHSIAHPWRIERWLICLWGHVSSLNKCNPIHEGYIWVVYCMFKFDLCSAVVIAVLCVISW